jgi:hypothetical protein
MMNCSSVLSLISITTPLRREGSFSASPQKDLVEVLQINAEHGHRLTAREDFVFVIRALHEQS